MVLACWQRPKENIYLHSLFRCLRQNHTVFAEGYMSKGRRNFHSTYPLYLFVVGIHTKKNSNFVISAEGVCVCNRRPSGANNRIWLFVSSVRSSNTHPDLLVIHPTSNHFFRSHRSSTLDFHFLCRYSYIKAIMLYKGNHWTHLLATCIPYGSGHHWWRHFGKILATFWLHFGYILATFWLHLGSINNCWRSVPLPCGQYKAIFYHSMTTLNFGGFGESTVSINWHLVIW